MASTNVTLRGFAELKSIFANAPKRVQQRGRDWLGEVAIGEADAIREEWDASAKPSSNRTGRFRQTIVPYARDWKAGVKFLHYPKLGLQLRDWILQGTRPHVIVPRRARVLHFMAGGQDVFTHIVHHPGTKPNDFIKRGSRKFDPRLRGMERQLKQQIIAELKQQIKRSR